MTSLVRALYPWVLGLLLMASALAGVALWVRADSGPGVEVLLPTPSPVPEVKIYLSGAVARPGVYDVSQGDRLADALEAAGGPTSDADLSAVNLALRVQDEGHYHVPVEGEASTTPGTTIAQGAPDRVNINTAPLELLQTLPGIGEARAQAILDYRSQNGPLASLEEVMKVEGIGTSTFNSIRELASVR